MVDPDFGPIHLGNPRTEYVAWIDLMGTGAIMEWSQDTATTNIGKLQVIMGECSEPYDLELYPMMDGCYAISDSESDILQFTSDVFERTSEIIVNRYLGRDAPPAYFSPVIRGGIAKGDVYHGSDINGSDLDDHPIQDSILIGRAVARAHSCESDAAPFSCIVHPTGWQKDDFGRLEWCADKYHAQHLVDALNTYFDYYSGKEDVNYPKKKIRKHREMAAGALLREESVSD
ncbi:hypothetical protein [Halostagnicola sp. A-GB9-2]|uniref:hypothetical protein n=1 Tax=Halostagnicola sp. A-GB9-2 TaxID=3048066 RepID=UPI0024C04588|nr:hypothetical protein [Halostagnicola sp. A-GB9-2]MDJ1434723.1 hypothetical protein [Halostagnicola sp. A-GB9-2]